MAKKKNDVFKITQFQPPCVTSSSIMVEVGDVVVLFDLGMEQDGKKTFKQLYSGACAKIKSIPFNKITHFVLSHSHYDHCGLAPILTRDDLGFNGTMIATELTMANAELIMYDAQEKNKTDVLKNGGEKDGYFLYYDKEHVEKMVKETRCYDYNRVIKLSDSVDLELLPACHLGGASMALLTYHTEYKDYKLLYSGDITYGQTIDRPFTTKIKDEKIKVDVLLCESTYGLRDREVPNVDEDPMDFLEQVIMEQVVQKNQTLWIPSFAVGRATTLYYYLSKIFERNEEIKKANIPVYFCGKMMYQAHKNIGKKEYQEYYDEQWREERDIFEKDIFSFLTSKQDVEHFCLNNGRKIVISSSGMYDKGYSALLADSYVANKKVSTCCCGFQSDGTLGYEIKNQSEYAQVNGIRKKVRLTYCGVIPNLSGHANHQGLLDFVKNHFNQGRLKHVILIHGDDDAKEELKEDLEKVLSKDKQVYIPKQFEIIKI